MPRAIALEALKTADSWMTTANLMIEKGIYNTALYAEEMSIEIGLKAIMLALGEDPPKVHNILESISEVINKSEKISQGDREKLKEMSRFLLPELLRTRQISGYTFNFNISDKELESLALKYIEPTMDALKKIREIISHVD
ncbi:MAG: HEPN domain-containing protein [Thermoplasmata archaeon]